MAKTIYLVRHAKSSWSDFSIQDFDRPLNERGKRDAPEMAQRLLGKNIRIDAFVSSPAKRAKKTASLFIKEYGREKGEIIFIDQLYLAEPPTFFEVIASLDDRYDRVAIFSHNNGITDFANQLTTTRIDEMPTCSVFAVEAEIEKWSYWKNAERRFAFFESPKGGEKV